MNLRDCKKLRVGDRVRMPSWSDGGSSVYYVRSVETDSPFAMRAKLAFTLTAESGGFEFRVIIAAWKKTDWSKVFKKAERVQ